MADRREIFDTLVLYLVFAAVLFKQENTKKEKNRSARIHCVLCVFRYVICLLKLVL
jgi:uncharacterized membrane protein SirB2